MLSSGHTPSGHVAFAPVHVAPLHWRTRSLPIAHELHSFILQQYKTQHPASNVAQALGYTLNQWKKIRYCFSQGVQLYKPYQPKASPWVSDSIPIKP